MNAQAGGGAAPAAVEPTTPGELLRQERERRALSLQQAGEDLHLDVWMIEAIEANRFAALGAPVYAKGHLRKYAILLGLSPQFVIERYEALGDTPAIPTPIPSTVALPVQRERRSLKLPLWIIVVALAAAAGWWLFNWLGERSAQVSASTEISMPADAVAPAALPVVEDPATIPPEDDGSAGSPDAAVAAASGEPGQAGAATTPPAQQLTANSPTPATDATSPPAAPIRLHLEFSEACWTEVYDASGRQLMFDLGSPGQARTVTGVPPLRVTLGLASAVSAQVDEHPIVVPRRAGRDAAKFLVQADGSVNPE